MSNDYTASIYFHNSYFAIEYFGGQEEITELERVLVLDNYLPRIVYVLDHWRRRDGTMPLKR